MAYVHPEKVHLLLGSVGLPWPGLAAPSMTWVQCLVKEWRQEPIFNQFQEISWCFFERLGQPCSFFPMSVINNLWLWLPGLLHSHRYSLRLRWTLGQQGRSFWVSRWTFLCCLSTLLLEFPATEIYTLLCCLNWFVIFSQSKSALYIQSVWLYWHFGSLFYWFLSLPNSLSSLVSFFFKKEARFLAHIC